MPIAYRAARVVDGVSERAIEDGVVVVDGGRVSTVAPAVGPSPGLVDTHVHLV